MNRYEFAILTVKAIDRFDKADQQQKQLIDKLSAEFAAELNRLGARVAKVEAKTSTWLLGGDARFRFLSNNPKYGAAKLNGSDATDWRVRLAFSGAVNEKTTVMGRFTTNYGIKAGDTQTNTEPFGNTTYIDIFNVNFKDALGFDKIRLGRTPLDVIGKGLIGKPMAVDGVTFYDTWGQAKFTGFTGNIKTTTITAPTNLGKVDHAYQLSTAQVGWNASKDTQFGVGYYWADIPGTSNSPVSTMLATTGSFRSSAGYDISVKQKMGNLTLLGDYVASSLDTPVNVPGSPKAWSVQLSNGKGPGATMAYYPTSYQLVRRAIKGDNAWAVIYRQADAGALPGGAGGFDTTAVSYALTPYNTYMHGTDNVKALYLVYQTVVDKNVVLSFEYQDFKVKNRAMTPLLTSDKLDSTFMTKIDCYF